MISRGIKDIIIAAPTGTGKTAIGATIAFWAGQKTLPLSGSPGGYYLVVQKLLQDQLEEDICRYPANLQSSTSLKTASEYSCSNYSNCGVGLMHQPICSSVPTKSCAYRRQVAKFSSSDLAITNYPYFFTERLYVKQMPPRRILIADEAHNLESQLLKFVELVIGPEEIVKYLPRVKEVPEMETLDDYTEWLSNTFLSGLSNYRDAFAADPAGLTPTRAKELLELDTMIARVERALSDMADDPHNWIFWQDVTQTLPKQPKMRTAIAKPLSAAPYFQDFLREAADVRIYMSAYPGTKDVFCQTLGLNPDATAMLSLGSVFDKQQRPIHAAMIGSMSKKNQPETLPRFLRLLSTLLNEHANEKGIIHGNSYALCNVIFEHFKRLPQGTRLLFPRRADERENVYRNHRSNNLPSVILSPSFTEGFDFADDAARWQVIAKIPFPYLGDKQIAARKEKDPEWYALRTVSTIVQASGRICRSEKDFGLTYITDSDFQFLWERWNWMFPAWWKEALIWP